MQIQVLCTFLLFSLLFSACEQKKEKMNTWKLQKTGSAIEIPAGFYSSYLGCKGLIEENGEELLYFADFQTKKELIFATMQGEIVARTPLHTYEDDIYDIPESYQKSLLVKSRDSILIIHPSGRLQYINGAGELQKNLHLRDVLALPLQQYIFQISSTGSYFDEDILYLYAMYIPSGHTEAKQDKKTFFKTYTKNLRSRFDFIRIKQPFGNIQVDTLKTGVLERHFSENDWNPVPYLYDYQAGKLCFIPILSNTVECIEEDGSRKTFDLEGIEKGTYSLEADVSKSMQALQERECVIFARYDPWRKVYYLLTALNQTKKARFFVFDTEQKLLAVQSYEAPESGQLGDMLLSKRGILVNSNTSESSNFSDSLIRYQLYEFE